MVLVSMRDHKSFDLVLIVLQISDIGYDKVYAQHIISRKAQTAVHHNNTVFILKGSNVHSNLLKTS